MTTVTEETGNQLPRPQAEEAIETTIANLTLKDDQVTTP